MQSVWRVAAVAAFWIATAAGSEAAAAILVDKGAAGSPAMYDLSDGPQPGTWSNTYGFQEFMVRAVLPQASIVQGMTIYTEAGMVNHGYGAVLRVFADDGGTMGGEIAQVVGNVDQTTGTEWDFDANPFRNIVAAHASFADVSLDAGVYWFSMSGWGTDLGWTSFVEEGQPETRFDQTELNYDVPGVGVFYCPTELYRLPFKVDGEVAAIPEPASWALLVSGFGLAGALLRRRRLVPALGARGVA